MPEFETFHRRRPVAAFPVKSNFPSADACPDIERHTACPPGYLAWQAWAERMSETHEQQQCPTCGYWAIWKPREAEPTDEGDPR